MTDAICYRDSYARRITARVISVEPGTSEGGPLVILDRTVFYPGGGGQPADRGVFLRAADGRSWTVRAARKDGAEIAHELEPGDEPPPSPGDELEIDLDWPRRHLLMRTHTALHALCGVVWRDYGAQVTGGNMEPGSGRMDFEFEHMNGDLVEAIEHVPGGSFVRVLGARHELGARRGGSRGLQADVEYTRRDGLHRSGRIRPG